MTRRLAAVLLVLAAGLAAPRAEASLVHRSAVEEAGIDLVGHGWGHGRGLGQWGAFGYAVDHGWSWPQILGHFYGGTTSGTVANDIIDVLLRSRSGLETVVYLEQGAIRTSIDGVLGGAGPRQAVRVVWQGGSSFRLFEGPGCGGPWTDRGAATASEVVVSPQLTSDNRADLLQLCEGATRRYLRGEVVAGAFTLPGSTALQHTLSRLPAEAYLRSVVPAESPASWGSAGAGAGMHALRAQAVAARSYALAGDSRWGGFADTCDDTLCQVYRGNALWANGVVTPFEAATTDLAVAETAGVVRMIGTGIARTEFSASTGGWTAGGTFPPVVDDGDDTAANPHHTWGVRLPVSQVEAAFDALAGWDLGALFSVAVIARNGLGEDGGRVLTVEARFTGGVQRVTGTQFRTMFGLRSDWFSVVGSASPPDNKTQPAGGYTLGSDGSLSPFGAAPPAQGTPALGGWARAVELLPRGRGGYVLDGWGGVHPVNGAPSLSGTYYQPGVDGARDIVLRADGLGGYVLDSFGGIHRLGNAPPVTLITFYDPAGIARRLSLRSDGTSGYVVDSLGRVHPFGGAPAVSYPALPAGANAMGIVLRPDGASGYVAASTGQLLPFGGAPPLLAGPGGIIDLDGRPNGASGYLVSGSGVVAPFGGATPAQGGGGVDRKGIALVREPAGYVLDRSGGLHPFGGAPPAWGTGWWPNQDVAKQAALSSNGAGGYVLDGWGGLHPFSVGASPMPPPAQGAAYWPGWDIARDVVLLPGAGFAGYVLDGWGGLHGFGGAPTARGTGWWPNQDVARRIGLLPSGRGGYVMDAWGGLHPFAVGSNPLPGPLTNTPYWPGQWDAARDVALATDAGGWVLDAHGGTHPVGAASGTGSWYWAAGIAAAAAVDPGQAWLVYVDGYGALHTAPSAAPFVGATGSWPGLAVARDVVVIPG